MPHGPCSQSAFPPSRHVPSRGVESKNLIRREPLRRAKFVLREVGEPVGLVVVLIRFELDAVGFLVESVSVS